MTEWVHQDHMTLVPNPNYVGTKPQLQKVTFLMVTDNEADYAAYRNNERDWTLVPDADVQAVCSDSQLSKETVEYTELTTWWLVMNNAKQPLDNPNVRKAFSKAIDRNALIRDIASGVGKPATSMIPPGMPGHQPDLGKDIDFDVNGAKQLLAQAGFNDPAAFPQLHFRYANTTGMFGTKKAGNLTLGPLTITRTANDVGNIGGYQIEGPGGYSQHHEEYPFPGMGPFWDFGPVIRSSTRANYRNKATALAPLLAELYGLRQ